MRTLCLQDDRVDLEWIMNAVVDDADVVLIVRHDAPNAVVMSKAHYDSLMETVYLLSSPANAAHLERSIAQSRAGMLTVHDIGN